MSPEAHSNWRASPSFDKVYKDLPACVADIIKEFSRRRRTQFVILKHLVNPTWHMMPFAQYRSLSPGHPANPCAICFFGTYHEFQAICLSFPPDLFSDASPVDLDAPDDGDLPDLDHAKANAAIDPDDKPQERAPDLGPNTDNPENS